LTKTINKYGTLLESLRGGMFLGKMADSKVNQEMN
jgi:hypothetical protein